jgi:FtsZ-binding cell division protein ZapB
MKCSESLTLLQIEVQSFKRKNKSKRHLQKRTLDEQERHLALGMPTLEMAHAEREREHTYKTTLKQSLSN